MKKGANPRPQHAAKSPAEPKTTGPHYISFNPEEWSVLEKLGFRERWAYMQLKWLANFKTGTVGKFRKQKITYTGLATLVTAPGVQGRGMGNIDDTQAADFLRRMQDVGLVGPITSRRNGGMCFDLLLSPIERNASQTQQPTVPISAPALISPEQPASQPVFSPDNDVPPFDEIPVTTRVSPPQQPFVSVMTLSESTINTDGAPSAIAADAPSSRASGAAAARDLAEPAATAAAPSKAQAASLRLSAHDIRENLAADWDWEQVDSLQAEGLYAQWAFQGITEGQLFQAKVAVVADRLALGLEGRHRPAELLAHLNPGGPPAV